MGKSVFDTAKYILRSQGRITTMKLQKLCYYSQAWSLAWDEVPLFDEDFQAWANGPVCPELFYHLKGQFSVQESSMTKGDISNLSSSEKDTIDKVLKEYGDKSPQWLSDLTHLENPWKDARQGIPSGDRCSNIIEKERIQEYYAGL